MLCDLADKFKDALDRGARPRVDRRRAKAATANGALVYLESTLMY